MAMMLNSPVTSHPLKGFYKDGVAVGHFSVATNWQEISGMAAPMRPENANYLWVESDSPAQMLAVVCSSDASNAGVWTLQGIGAGVDYEDLSSARINGQPYIYLSDSGNNNNVTASRANGADLVVYRIKEPVVTGSNGTIAYADITVASCAFPVAGFPIHRDVEICLVDPDTGKIYFITKREPVAGVFSLEHQESYSGVQTLVDEGDMFDIPNVATQALGTSTPTNVTAGRIHPTGKEIVIQNYGDVYRFERPDKSVSIMATLQATPVTLNAYVGGGLTSPRKSHPSAEPQGESLTWDYYGQNLYSASEFVATEGSRAGNYPLFKYERISSSPTAVSFQDGVFPTAAYAGTSDTTIWDTNPGTDYGSDTTFVCDKAPNLETDQRKGLLKFDLSAIPSTAVVVGVKLNLWIAAEGQGIAFYRVLTQDWNESSTYNSTTGGMNDDGTEVASSTDCANGVNIDTIVSIDWRNNMNIDTVQGWVNGTYPNYGWLIESKDYSGDGMQFDSAEGATAGRHPRLTVYYN